jgi:xanthosine utilization system XapX-like protein
MPMNHLPGHRLDVFREKLRSLNRLSPLQLKTLTSIWTYVVLLLLIDGVSGYAIEHGNRMKALMILLDILPAVPTLAILGVLGRYLSRETDEFIRMLVVKALLWSAAFVVVAATVQSALAKWSAEWTLAPTEVPLMNAGIFIAVTMIALCLEFRRNR